MSGIPEEGFKIAEENIREENMQEEKSGENMQKEASRAEGPCGENNTSCDLFSVLPQEENASMLLPAEKEENMEQEKSRPETEKSMENTPVPDALQKEEPTSSLIPIEIPEEKALEQALDKTGEKEKPLEMLSEAENKIEKKGEIKKQVSLIHLKGKTLGELLTAAREEQKMSIDEVRERTLIRAEYIQALEDNEHQKLPPIIFIKAYIRALQELYNLDEASSEMLREYLAEIEPAADVPEKVVDELNKNVQINEEEARKVRLTGYYMLGGLALLFIFIVALVIYFAVIRGKNVQEEGSGQNAESVKVVNKNAPAQADPERITSLIPQIIPEEQLMPLPAKRRK